MATAKIIQQHYNVSCEISSDATNNFRKTIETIAQMIEEYVELEDATADYTISFTIGPSFSATRRGSTLSVVVQQMQQPSVIVKQLAPYLIDIYDEMDSDFTDDIYDLESALDLGREIEFELELTPPTTTKKKSAKKKSAKKTGAKKKSAKTSGVKKKSRVTKAQEAEFEFSVEDADNIFIIAFDILKTKPYLQAAMGMTAFFEKEDIHTQILAQMCLVGYINSARIKRVHDTIVGMCKKESRGINDDEALLLYIIVELENLNPTNQMKYTFDIPKDDDFFDRSRMVSLSDVRGGKVAQVLVPGINASPPLKSLVAVNSDGEYACSLGLFVTNSELEEPFTQYDSIVNRSAAGGAYREAKSGASEALNAYPDIRKSLEIEDLPYDDSNVGLYLALAVNETRRRRFYNLLGSNEKLAQTPIVEALIVLVGIVSNCGV